MSARIWLCAPADRQQRVWMVIFDDPDVQSRTFSGHGAEEAARRFWAKRSRSFNCHLLATVPATPGWRDQ